MDKFFDAISTKLTSQDENQKKMEAKFNQIAKNHSFLIHNINVQLGYLAIVVIARRLRNLLSNTETNPRDVKAITLRISKELKSKVEMENEGKNNKANEQNEEVEDSMKEKAVESEEEKMQSSSLPLVPKIIFP